MAYYYCFSLGSNIDFPEFLQKKFYNISYWFKLGFFFLFFVDFCILIFAILCIPRFNISTDNNSNDVKCKGRFCLCFISVKVFVLCLTTCSRSVQYWHQALHHIPMRLWCVAYLRKWLFQVVIQQGCRLRHHAFDKYLPTNTEFIPIGNS